MENLLIALVGQNIFSHLSYTDIAALECFLFVICLYSFFNVVKTLVRGVM